MMHAMTVMGGHRNSGDMKESAGHVVGFLKRYTSS